MLSTVLYEYLIVFFYLKFECNLFSKHSYIFVCLFAYIFDVLIPSGLFTSKG